MPDIPNWSPLTDLPSDQLEEPFAKDEICKAVNAMGTKRAFNYFFRNATINVSLNETYLSHPLEDWS